MSNPPRPQPKTDYRKPALAGAVAVFLLLGGTLAWAATAMLASAVIASGSVIVAGKPKSVQHLDGGIVKAIHVDTGMRVARNDVLIELDDTTIAANLAIYRRRLREAVVAKERLAAELEGQSSFAPPDGLARLLGLGDLSTSIAQQRSLMQARQLTRHGQLEQLDERIAQLRNQIRGAASLRREKLEQVARYDEEIATVSGLASQSLAPRSHLLGLERARSELRGAVAEQDAEVARLENVVTETRLAKLQIDREFRERVIAELEKVDGQIDELRQQMEATRKQLARVAIRAPESGVVHELSVYTLGGVIQPGQTVMQIVPQTGRNEVELNVDIHSIDQVTVGQRAILRFPAFHQRTTPEVEGVVESISPSSVIDAERGVAFYRVAVSVRVGELEKLGAELIPGMPVEGFLPIAERTVLNYLLKPLTDHIQHAFREE